MQTQAEIDTADLMTRYGTKLALSSGGISPITGAATVGAIGSAAPPAVRF